MTRLARRQLLVQLAAGALGTVAATALPPWARAQPTPPSAPKKTPPGPLAIIGGTLLLGKAEPIADSVVLIDEGELRYLGTDKTQAKGARTVSAKGQMVTAGLVDLLTRIGTTEVSLEKTTRDDSHETADPVRAAFRSADGYNPASSLIAITRMQGVTSVGVVPVAGLVTGQSAWADLAGKLPRDALARPSLALHVNLHDAMHGAFGKSRGTAWLKLRELLDDGKAYRANRAGYQRRQIRKLGVSRLDLEVVVRALEGRLPVVFHVDRASDIAGVLTLAKDNGLRAVLASAAEGWKVADQIAKAKVPAIVYPLDHGPRSFAALGAREDNAALLHQAGVTVALSTGESHNARKLRQEVGNAIRAGLPRRTALDAVTDAPARIMGMDQAYGTPKVGRPLRAVDASHQGDHPGPRGAAPQSPDGALRALSLSGSPT
jgi:imidazolonepropionase-like amidohydrolase